MVHVCVCLHMCTCTYMYSNVCIDIQSCLYKEIHYVSIQADREHYRHNSVLLREKKIIEMWRGCSYHIKFSVFSINYSTH